MHLSALLSILLTLLLTPHLTHAAPSEPSAPSLLFPRDGPGSVVTCPAGLSWYEPSLTCGGPGRKNVTKYTCYRGPAKNFPKIEKWMSFEAMWKLQVEYALKPVGDTAVEIQDIRKAIVEVSKKAKVDARVILAVVIHESTGNVKVPCTISYGGIPNCGLMQSYNATTHTYNASQPLKSITRMIVDGTQGTASGPGLVQLFNDAADTNQETHGNVYAVFRAYNSGTVNAGDLSDGEGADAAYVSDMANYLMGWNGYGPGAAKCSFTSVSPTPTPTPPTCTSTAYIPPPTQTVLGTTPDCCTWHTVTSGDTCDAVDNEYNITFADLQAWNTYLDATCSNLWLNYAYCVDSDDAVPTTTISSTSTSTSKSTSTTSTTKTTTTSSPATCVPSAYIPAPTATRAGSTADCCEWYTISSGDTCDRIDTAHGISFAQMQAWNSYVDSTCDNIWADTAVCVDSDDAVSSTTTSSTSTTPTPTPTATSTTTTTTAVPTTCASSAYVPAPTQTRAGSTADCCEWYTVVSGDNCGSIDAAYDITFAEMQAWNTYVDAACDNLWAGYAVCVDSDDPV